jgi:hypothetical protein
MKRGKARLDDRQPFYNNNYIINEIGDLIILHDVLLYRSPRKCDRCQHALWSDIENRAKRTRLVTDSPTP